MLTCGDDFGTASETLEDEAHIDSVSKCKAHLSKAEQAMLDEAGRFTTAGNERGDELAKEGARDDSFRSILHDTYTAAVETSKATLAVSFSERREENDGQMWSRRLRDGMRKMSWKRAASILARLHALRRRGRPWHCEVCDKRATGGTNLCTTLALGLSRCSSQLLAGASCHQKRSDNKSAVRCFADARVLSDNGQVLSSVYASLLLCLTSVSQFCSQALPGVFRKKRISGI